MNIAIIGHGNVGATLAKGWAKAGHQVIIGARNEADEKLESLVSSDRISVNDIPGALQNSDVILVAIPAQAVKEFAETLSNVADKVFIDATNSVFLKDAEFATGAEAIKAMSGAIHVVKGFNTTGFENMADPIYDGQGIDMFTAGDSQKGKEVVKQLSEDLGFEGFYDFGGDDKFELIEQFAFSWINLAIMQGEGRGIAFKVLRRD